MYLFLKRMLAFPRRSTLIAATLWLVLWGALGVFTIRENAVVTAVIIAPLGLFLAIRYIVLFANYRRHYEVIKLRDQIVRAMRQHRVSTTQYTVLVPPGQLIQVVYIYEKRGLSSISISVFTPDDPEDSAEDWNLRFSQQRRARLDRFVILPSTGVVMLFTDMVSDDTPPAAKESAREVQERRRFILSTPATCAGPAELQTLLDLIRTGERRPELEEPYNST